MKPVDVYRELLETVKGYSKEVDLSDVVDAYGLQKAIEREVVSDLFNIPIHRTALSGQDWFKMSEFASIGWFSGKDNGRQIAWSDSGLQPEEEWLYVVCFPTGPYLFGSDYPVKTFKAFFDELMTYNPRYSDSHNKTLYFSPNKASAVHRDLSRVLNKYKIEVGKETNAQRIEKLEAELRELRNKGAH